MMTSTSQPQHFNLDRLASVKGVVFAMVHPYMEHNLPYRLREMKGLAYPGSSSAEPLAVTRLALCEQAISMARSLSLALAVRRSTDTPLPSAPVRSFVGGMTVNAFWNDDAREAVSVILVTGHPVGRHFQRMKLACWEDPPRDLAGLKYPSTRPEEPDDAGRESWDEERIGNLSDDDLVEMVADHVYHASILDRVGGGDFKFHSDMCSRLHRWCSENGKADLYQRGWASGTEGLR